MVCLSLGVAANAEKNGAYVLMNIPYQAFSDNKLADTQHIEFRCSEHLE